MLRTGTRLSKHRVSDRARPSRLPYNDKMVGKLLTAAAPACPFSTSMNVAYEIPVILVDNERVMCLLAFKSFKIMLRYHDATDLVFVKGIVSDIKIL